jgi:hypothetical protein
MVHKRYIIDLTHEEREHLLAFISKGKAPARALLKARILLKADAGAPGEGWTDGHIAEALETNITMIERPKVLRRRWRAKSAKHPLSNRFSTARLRPS